MTDIFNKVLAWVKSNMWLSIGIGLVAIILFFPRLLRMGTTRRRRRVVHHVATRIRRRIYKAPVKRTKRNYAKGGTRKKPWQIKGSLAAKRYMAAIRRKR